MVGPDDLVTAIQHRQPGETVIYGNTDDGSYWVTVTTTSTNTYYNNPFHHTDYPWEERLKEIIVMGAKFREDFKTLFRGGLIPHKGYPGLLPPIQDLPPPLATAAPAPDDRRRVIWAFTTVRPLRVP